MSRVFVTGATGLIGGHLLYHLLDGGHEVIALRRITSRLDGVHEIFKQYEHGEELWNKITWVNGDVLNFSSLTSYLSEVDIIYHCAAVVSFDSGDAVNLTNTNIQGTYQVAELCTTLRKRLCYFSSIAAVGDAVNEGDLIDENTLPIPDREHSEYSRSKVEAERIVWKYIDKGLDAVIVCPSVILAADRFARSSARLYASASKGVPFYTGGGTGYVDVRDVARLAIRLSEDKNVSGERFILNGGNHTFREFFTYVAKVNGKLTPKWKLPLFVSGMLWRISAVLGWIMNKRPSLTRETLQAAEHLSCYSSKKLLSLYPDYHFYTLQETIDHIHSMEYK